MMPYIKLLLYCLGLMSMYLGASPFTAWKEASNDPIYMPYPSASLLSADDYAPSVIFSPTKFDGNGAAFNYKMWHQSPNGIALSYSNDGTNWTLVGEVVTDPGDAFHASVIYDKNGFSGSPYYYKMWYWTGTSGSTPPDLPIKFTQSVDGVHWTTPRELTQDTTLYLTNDTKSGQAFNQFYGFGQVIYNPTPTFVLGNPYTFPYVAFFDAGPAGVSPQTAQEAVGLAYSMDGLNWFRYGSVPVLLPSGSITNWDGVYAYRASVIRVNGIWHMFYSGSSGVNNPAFPNFTYTFGIGHASSTDGIVWTKDSDNPIFSVVDFGEEWRSGRTLFSWVIVNPSFVDGCCNNKLLGQMWFSGGTNNGGSFATLAIGYATLPIKVERMWLKKMRQL